MKKKWWIILICVIVLVAAGVAVWYFNTPHKNPYGYDFNEETGCYKVRCSSYENCSFQLVCPGQSYFHEWRKDMNK